MNQSLKPKIIMFVSMIFFMGLYMVVFGSKNTVIGIIIVLATLMNLKNDFSFKPKTSFIKVLSLLLILGIASYLNNPLTIWGCLLTFIVVFGTTFTSYDLFGLNVYIPYLMCYFMMVGIPVTQEMLPSRLLSLVFGAIFIVGINILVNKKKDYNLSKKTINNLVNELNTAIDLKLNGKEVSVDNFNVANGFYKSMLDKFEYKYFPTKNQQIALNIIKSFQYIGIEIANNDLTDNELKYTKEMLSKIRDIDSSEVFEGIELESKEMASILLNLEILANEVKKDLSDDSALPDKKTVFSIIKPIIKNEFSFKSPKLIFAFKMAIMLFIWQVLTLVFNLPFTKWLYFVTLPLMMPYIDDLEYMAKARIKGTFVGVFLFAIILILLPHIPISSKTFLVILMVVCMWVMVFKLQDKFIMTIATTMMSVMSALMYITPPEAIELKVLWVVIGVCAVSLFNFKFLPYSVEIETKNNLKLSCKLNSESIKLIKEKCCGIEPDNKSTVLVVSNIVREYIEVTDENKELYDLQVKITDISNFILNYLDTYSPSNDLKNNLISIIDGKSSVDDKLNIKDRVIAFSTCYVKKLYENEKAIVRDLK